MAAATAAAALLCSGCFGAYLEPLPKEAEVHHPRTPDGWDLEMVRYAARPEAKGRPVLLCHGINANGRNMDLDARHSIARWFAAHGREAWTVSMRPSGAYYGKDGGTRPLSKPGFSLDDMMVQDIPTAVDYVRKVTGAPKVDYVGHSLGGIVGYGYLGRGGQGVGAAVILGSPMRLDLGTPVDLLLPQLAGMLGAGWTLPMKGVAPLGVPMADLFPENLQELLLFNPENTTRETMKRLMVEGTEDVSTSQLQQLALMLKTGELKSLDGTLDYRQALATVTTPVLVVAGKRDRLATVPAVKAGYRALGGPKEWKIMGVENGARADYGHMDMVIGDRADTELWPALLDFFDRHAR
ncbi:MAG TPA: alpha/beta fold hydrolase [Myxococcaceae bacterium]|nr:alpha/beta fold hydrolase [Myxococcaceae bacterium]